MREAREFVFEAGDLKTAMRPWTTALAQIGPYGKLIAYEAKRHVVLFMDNDPYENNDRVVNRLPQVEARDGEAWKRANGYYDLEDDDDEEEEEHDVDEEDKEDGNDEEEGQEEGDAQDAHWDYIEARLAGHVLRDILDWYRDLVCVPGCAELPGRDSWMEELRVLYHKHEWPGEKLMGAPLPWIGHGSSRLLGPNPTWKARNAIWRG